MTSGVPSSTSTRPRRALAMILALAVAGWLAWYTGIVPGGRMTPEEQLKARAS